MKIITKEKLIHQILNENNDDIYLFLCMKFLNEYPEYKEKIQREWNDNTSLINEKIYINKDKNITTRENNFTFVISHYKERKYFLNWLLRIEGYD